MKTLALIIGVFFANAGVLHAQAPAPSGSPSPAAERVRFENIPSDAVLALHTVYADMKDRGLNLDCYKFTFEKDAKSTSETPIYRIGTGYIGEYWNQSKQDAKFFDMKCGPNYLYYVTGKGVISQRITRK
ncbi:hypothetical protein [Asticcacaulis sp. W401b]|uniref:hypothetical protein n=1 Tax=Asticcacaulis sp. W401b TaxID=3388666 RepID=UPI00397109D4